MDREIEAGDGSNPSARPGRVRLPAYPGQTRARNLPPGPRFRPEPVLNTRRGRFGGTGRLAARLFWLSLVCILLAAEAGAESAPANGRIASATETWTKDRICAGQPADLGPLPDHRLGAGFLSDLIFGRLCDLPPRGVHIVRAVFTERIDLQGTNVAVPFRLRHSRFDGPVSLERVRADKVLSFAGSHFSQPVVMNEIDVRGSLFLGGGATYAAPVLLQGAQIGGQAVFGSDSLDRPEIAVMPAPGTPADKDEPEAPTRFAAALDMSDSRVAGSLDLSGIIAKSQIVLDHARVDEDLRLTGARFCGELNMGTVRIGGSVEAWGIAWPGPPACPPAKQPEDVASGAEPATSWSFYNSDVGGNLFLSGADLVQLGLLNLSGTRIGGQLFLGSIDHMPPNVWGDRTVLMLRNVSVGKIQDLGAPHIDRQEARQAGDAAAGRGAADAVTLRESWAPLLVLDGFTYGSWDGLGREERSYGNERRVVSARDDAWLIAWLARDRSYTRQPYEQLAAVMDAQGRRASRNAILFTSRDIERCIAAGDESGHAIEACVLRKSNLTGQAATIPLPRAETGASPEVAAGTESRWQRTRDAAVMTAIWLVNGYGYRPARALAWFLLLIVIGTFLFRYRTAEGRGHSVWFAAEYTMHTMLPAVTLRQEFEAISISNGVRYYFVFLKVMGYVFVATILQVFYQLVGQSGR